MPPPCDDSRDDKVAKARRLISHHPGASKSSFRSHLFLYLLRLQISNRRRADKEAKKDYKQSAEEERENRAAERSFLDNRDHHIRPNKRPFLVHSTQPLICDMSHGLMKLKKRW